MEIVYGEYISEFNDYSGPDLNPYLFDLDGSGKATVANDFGLRFAT